MEKKIWKHTVALVFCMVLLCSSIFAYAQEDITRGGVDYEVVIQDASYVFIGNDKPVDWEVGDKYFLAYTVEKVTQNDVVQSGMLTTDNRELHHPYTSGGLQYAQKNLLCEEGYTYFLRFEVSEEGMKYVAAKANAKTGESEYIRLPYQAGDLKKKTPYFGLWLGEMGKVTAKLSHVRCYDQNGNNLGIFGNKSLGVLAIDESRITPMKGIEHTYAFSLEDASTIFFGSARKSDSDTIFMEYTIKNVKAQNIGQTGAVMTKDTTVDYPHTTDYGYLNYQQHTAETEAPRLVSEGAHYLVRFDRTDKAFEVLIKRTMPDGAVDYFSFPHFYGTESTKWPYVGIWIGEKCSLTADFVDVKCYDAEGNNLAITTNRGVLVEHFGNLEDYSKCEAVYYCEANETFISLDDECNASRKVDGEEVANMGTYSIRKTTLSLNIAGETEEFDYVYTALTDKEGNRYVRLKETKVTFYSRFLDGKILETVEVTPENGFKVAKPENPQNDGHTFLCWKTAENKEYDFDSVVTGATELYASWEGEDAWDTVGAMVVSNAPLVITIAVSAILVVATVISIVLIGRRKKDGKAKEETK